VEKGHCRGVGGLRLHVDIGPSRFRRHMYQVDFTFDEHLFTLFWLLASCTGTRSAYSLTKIQYFFPSMLGSCSIRENIVTSFLYYIHAFPTGSVQPAALRGTRPRYHQQRFINFLYHFRASLLPNEPKIIWSHLLVFLLHILYGLLLQLLDTLLRMIIVLMTVRRH
jgi:hypothetical protein